MRYSQNQKSPKGKKPLLLLVLVLLGAVVAGVVVNSKNRSHSENQTVANNTQQVEKIDYSPPTEAETQQLEDNKTQDGGPVRNNESSPVAADKSVLISQADFDNENKRAVIQTQLNGTGWLKCQLELSQGASKIIRNADTLYQPSFSTCMGFSVSADEFPAGGTWNASLQVTNKDGGTYSATEKTINIIK